MESKCSTSTSSGRSALIASAMEVLPEPEAPLRITSRILTTGCSRISVSAISLGYLRRAKRRDSEAPIVHPCHRIRPLALDRADVRHVGLAGHPLLPGADAFAEQMVFRRFEQGRRGTRAGAPCGRLAGLTHMVAAARASSLDCQGQRQARDRAAPFKRRRDLQQECFLDPRRPATSHRLDQVRRIGEQG